jgi:pyruvate dehydrogenase E2 component (dihydrolipoamide acetyltransferase)
LSQKLEIVVPDIGDFDEVEVVEILVAKGDVVEFDDPLVSIESDKATMEIPSTAAGVVVELRVAEGDRVGEGSVLAVIEASGESLSVDDGLETPASSEEAPAEDLDESDAAGTQDSSAAKSVEELAERPGRVLSPDAANPVPDRAGLPHASPLVRRYARDLGVPISESSGSGAHGRILIDDLKRQVRDRFSGDTTTTPGASGIAIPPMPKIDHAAF